MRSRAFSNGEAAALTRQSDETMEGKRGRENEHARIPSVSRPSSLALTTFILQTAMQLVSNILGWLVVAAAALVLVVQADDEVI